MAIEAVIFDVGNVLIEERWDLVEKELRKITPDVTLSQFRAAVKGKHWKDYSEGRIQPAEFWDYIAAEIEIDKKYSNKLSSVFSRVWSPDDYSVLDSLKHGIKTYVLTNSTPENEEVFEKIVILLDKKYYSHRIGVSKPDPNAYLMILSEQDLIPQKTLFVDDKQINLEAAAKLGIVTELCQSPQDLGAILAKYDLLR